MHMYRCAQICVAPRVSSSVPTDIGLKCLTAEGHKFPLIVQRYELLNRGKHRGLKCFVRTWNDVLLQPCLYIPGALLCDVSAGCWFMTYKILRKQAGIEKSNQWMEIGPRNVWWAQSQKKKEKKTMRETSLHHQNLRGKQSIARLTNFTSLKIALFWGCLCCKWLNTLWNAVSLL